MILLAGGEGLKHRVRMHRLIWALAVRISSKTRFRLEWPIFSSIHVNTLINGKTNLSGHQP